MSNNWIEWHMYTWGRESKAKLSSAPIRTSMKVG